MVNYMDTKALNQTKMLHLLICLYFCNTQLIRYGCAGLDTKLGHESPQRWD
jgi:hypothetical protein